MSKLMRCVWCGDEVGVNERVYRNDYGEVKETRCSKCEGIIAAYVAEKQPVLEGLKRFKN